MGVGAYALIEGTKLLQSWFLLFGIGDDWNENARIETIISGVLIFVVPLAVLALGLKFMFRPPQMLLARFPEEQESQPGEIAPSEILLRTGATLIGVFVLVTAAGRTSSFVYSVIMMARLDPELLVKQLGPGAISLGIQLILGLYLLFGAPHLVRWQMKILKSRSEGAEQGAEESPAA